MKTQRELNQMILALQNLAHNCFDTIEGEDRLQFQAIIKELKRISEQLEDF